MASRRKQTIATYGRRGHRVVAVEDEWLDVAKATKQVKEPKLFSSLSSNDSVLSSSAHSVTSSAEKEREQVKKYPKSRLKLKKGPDVTRVQQSTKENSTPCTPSLSIKQTQRTYTLRKTAKKTGSCSSTGSEGIFESVTKKAKRLDKRVLRDNNVNDVSVTPESNFKTSTAATGRKKTAATGKKKNTKTGPIEQSRKAVWGNCSEYNFSDFDSFDLVVETSSEAKAKKDLLEAQNLLTKTPVSRHGKSKKNDYRLSLVRTPQIPEIPKINLHAMNAFSYSMESLPNSPAIENCSNRFECTGYIHTSSPRVESGFEADRSQSYNSSNDKYQLSHAHSSPLADISAISNVSDEHSVLSNMSPGVSHMPSIDENSISNFSNAQPSNSKQKPSKSNKLMKSAALSSPVSCQNQEPTCDLSVHKQLDDMVKLTEQLSLMSSEDNNSQIPQSHTNHQTPKQYFTRQYAKSTQKLSKVNMCNVSKASSTAHSSLIGRVATRSVAKSILSEVSYDASQDLFDTHNLEHEGSDGELSERSFQYEIENSDDQYETESEEESLEEEEDDDLVDSDESNIEEQHNLDVIEEDNEESMEETSEEDEEGTEDKTENEQNYINNSEMDSGTRYMLGSNPPSLDNSRSSLEQSAVRRSSVDQEFCTPRKDVLTELARENRNLKIVLTPIKLNVAGIVPSAKDKVLSQCDQTDYCSFADVFSAQMFKKCVKIGEGVFGEVFRSERRNQSVALKVIPIEGDFPVNDEPQKTFEEILPEIVISKEVSALSSSFDNSTPNFVQVKSVSVVQGCYPDVLLEQWDIFHKRKVSENDRPDLFGDSQLFLVFEFEDSGAALESFQFTSLDQAKSILHQVSLSLAIGEKELEFEHRDLHWGNVLVKHIKGRDKSLKYKLDGEDMELDSYGVKAAVIDFTLSRLQKDGCTLFTDLSTDPTLFTGQGDYQFEVYRLMQKENGNEWKSHRPFTNVLWIHYTADKLLNATRYENSDSKEHKSLVRQFRAFLREALQYSSAQDLVKNCSLFAED